ncbi:hypothetical protein CCHL11_06891 [Colletotrichum chlorophyti]|uniref:Uncharacterized protein n=1 Tax=Colletotrichum chlorophyti TaxID=708187 RepID=A0A1Q8RBJ8_9PEZI|nr:hypothetical protein CCHL11_06891 [Colletotrichum chlorophyti]
MNASFGIVEYSFPMWSKKHVGSWLDAFKPRQSPASSRTSSPASASSSRRTTGRRGGAPEERELLIVIDEEPRRVLTTGASLSKSKSKYMPRHAGASFLKTTTSKEIRKNGEIL